MSEEQEFLFGEVPEEKKSVLLKIIDVLIPFV